MFILQINILAVEIDGSAFKCKIQEMDINQIWRVTPKTYSNIATSHALLELYTDFHTKTCHAQVQDNSARKRINMLLLQIKNTNHSVYKTENLFLNFIYLV